ncbi:MAG: DedA family protein [Calditrichia bacterium]
MDAIIQQLLQLGPVWAYFLLFVSAFVENVFPPIPGDTVTVLGAYLVGRKILSFWGVYAATTAGSILGFMTIFGVAYWLEWKFIERYNPKWIARSHIDRVEKWFRKYGYWIVLFNRFLSGTRSVVSIVAGLSKMKPVFVFILALISGAIWNGILIYLGATIGKNWEEIIQIVKLYNRVIIIATIVVIAALLATWFIKKRQRQNKPADAENHIQ